MIIGLDDTDSKDGMCTTYLAAVLIERLKIYGPIKGYPFLIRLNPNIKYKTRGNAAIAFTLVINKSEDAQYVKKTVIAVIEEMAVFSAENTNPGAVFLEDGCDELKNDLASFSMRAVQDVLTIREAEDFLVRHGISCMGFKNGRGLIGALAAAGFVVCGLPDITYELIAYREIERWGTPRQIDEGSVYAADSATFPDTWDTIDRENERVVFAPHSPDPILFGIRGNSETAVTHAFSMIKSEPVERYVIYQTNQNTDMHLIRAELNEVLNDRSYILTGKVSRDPGSIAGGHVIFEISDNEAAIECMAFEPTKGFRNIIRQLRTGDEITVFGSVKDGTMNLEKIRIDSLVQNKLRNPMCCEKRMKSMGKGQGFRCKKCGNTKNEQEMEALSRNIQQGFYEVPPCARRHLAKPVIRLVR